MSDDARAVKEAGLSAKEAALLELKNMAAISKMPQKLLTKLLENRKIEKKYGMYCKIFFQFSCFLDMIS